MAANTKKIQRICVRTVTVWCEVEQTKNVQDYKWDDRWWLQTKYEYSGVHV